MVFSIVTVTCRFGLAAYYGVYESWLPSWCMCSVRHSALFSTPWDRSRHENHLYVGCPGVGQVARGLRTVTPCTTERYALLEPSAAGLAAEVQVLGERAPASALLLVCVLLLLYPISHWAGSTTTPTAACCPAAEGRLPFIMSCPNRPSSRRNLNVVRRRQI